MSALQAENEKGIKAMSMNKIFLQGRIVNDIELRHTPNGVSTCSFRIAVDRDFKAKSGEKETDFITLVAWRNTADFISSYFEKGRMIFVEGRLQMRDYTDRNGNKRTAVIFANHYLISHGGGLLVIPEYHVPEFKRLLVLYYEDRDKDELREFMKNECIRKYKI